MSNYCSMPTAELEAEPKRRKEEKEKMDRMRS
jgi:hypothetical protein